MYWKAPEAAGGQPCEVTYRAAGGTKWKQALPLWFDARNQEYRGSIVNLQPDTTYEVSLRVRGTQMGASLQAHTWSETFPVSKKSRLPPRSDKMLAIAESGTPEGYVLYESAGAVPAVIDVAGGADYCLTVKASYVILRGLTLKGAKVHAIMLGEDVHDVVIEGCDISGWGRIAEDGWGKDYDAAIYSKHPGVKRIIVQRNRIHHPRSNSNNWQQARPRPGKREPSHPEGPQAVCLWDSAGNHVIRYNTVFSDDDHQYNDIFGAGQNFSTRGFPNRDSDIYGNLLSHCWDDAIESEGANCNVRIWGNYITDAFVGVACASTSIGPLYVWRNVTGVIRESPTKIAGAFLKTSNKMGGGKIYVFHNTVLQPTSLSDPNKTAGAVVGLGWGGPMTNVTSRNNILQVTRQVIVDRAHDSLGDYDYDLFSLPLTAGENQEKHGLHGKPAYVPGCGLKAGRGTFALAAASSGFDAGLVIPNFNDGFAGTGPDIGAHEAGAPPMEFGVEAYRNRTAQNPRTVLPLEVEAGLGLDDFWKTGPPSSQGLSAAKLDALQKELAVRGTKALLVIRNETIVCEWYAPGQDRQTRFGTASLAKALVGGVSCAVAMSDGRIGLDDPAVKFIPQWRDDPAKSRITIRQLGSHTSGVEDAEADNKPHDQLDGWKGDFWKHLPVPNDPFTISRDQAPLVFAPGAEMRYSNPGIALLTYCVTASLKDSGEKDIRSLLRERVLRPIGVPDAEWSAGYGKTSAVDGLPLVGSWGGAAFTARAAARVGRLMLRDGDWDGKRILSDEAVRQTTSDAGTPGPCGIGWWSNNEGDCAKLPRDAFFGSGAGHQILLVVPSLKLVVVRFGSTLAETGRAPNAFHEAYRLYLFEPLMEALLGSNDLPAPRRSASTAEPPYPPSPVIARIDWAPKETIIRQARGSDNWPLTWAEDDDLYTAYGDGNGFEPFSPEKLSMGFARITAGPVDARGTNIRSSGESRGDGARGKKASGLLCVNGVLYVVVRNVGNSQLGWSADHGRNWTWADWKFSTSFGCPTFLNFGRNYAGARDEFVYLFSLDSDNAYEAADRMVLARVPQSELRRRGAYEFFVTLDAQGRPVWSSDIAERGAVFMHPGCCYRSGITYNAALKRYLWVQILPQSRHAEGPRFQGGFGVYDAPEPWGPWTTVSFTQDWDVGPGETGSFPTKWMSRDGLSLAYVFSGNDSFSVRRAALVLKSGARAKKPRGAKASGL